MLVLRDAAVDDAHDASVVDVTAPPPPVTRTATVWPMHAFDRAEAVTFNWVAEQWMPHLSNYAYDEHGWNQHLAERHPITIAQAKRAIELLHTFGEFEWTGCTFARHAVVLFEGDTPVASINVCFECGAVLSWPDEGRPPHVSVKQWTQTSATPSCFAILSSA